MEEIIKIVFKHKEKVYTVTTKSPNNLKIQCAGLIVSLGDNDPTIQELLNIAEQIKMIYVDYDN